MPITWDKTVSCLYMMMMMMMMMIGQKSKKENILYDLRFSKCPVIGLLLTQGNSLIRMQVTLVDLDLLPNRSIYFS